MGAWRRAGRAAVCAAVLGAAARVAAESEVEPIARLSLEGGYDSNALYEGLTDRTTRISPELGIRGRDHLWDLSAVYGADWIRYQRLQPDGAWSHRLRLALDMRPTRRWRALADARAAYAYDPVGLALQGIFRTGQQAAWIGRLRARATYEVAPRVEGLAEVTERYVRFNDLTGGAVHGGAVAGMWSWTERLSVGAGYRLAAFQTFLLGGGVEIAYANGVEGRLSYELDRHLRLEASAGPELFRGPHDTATVPAATVTLYRDERDSDLRVTAHHGLGIGSTAAPGLVTSIDGGAVRRFGRSFLLRGDGGVWYSGVAPSGAHPVLGFAVAGEAAWLMSRGVRLSLVAARFATLDQPDAERLSRTTVGLRLGWELESR